MGRLCDVDDQREGFMEMVYEQLADDPDNIRANLIIEYFDSMPTVDAVPVVHGTYTESEENEEWYGKEYQCNSCGTECMVSNANGFELSPKICPICGVRFDGREE